MVAFSGEPAASPTAIAGLHYGGLGAAALGLVLAIGWLLLRGRRAEAGRSGEKSASADETVDAFDT